jgi:mono/diheme cytochrome c family protein
MLMVAPALAQDVGRPQAGRIIAQNNCAQCHAVQKGESRSPNNNAPAFDTIAAVPGMTAIALTVALRTPHRTMPNIVLQDDETRDIIAYILSLGSGG